MLLKIWPHLTFGWPFVNISLTLHPTHSKLYIFVILITSRVIWYTWKVIWSILKFWPPLDLCVTPTGKGPNLPKFCQNIFRPITTSKPSITHFRQNGTWVFLPLQSSFVIRSINKLGYLYSHSLLYHTVCKIKYIWQRKIEQIIRAYPITHLDSRSLKRPCHL